MPMCTVGSAEAVRIATGAVTESMSSGTLWRNHTPGWDSATADSTGTFVYHYKLDGIQGTYEIRAYDTPWTGDRSDAPIVSKTFTDANLQRVAHDSR